MTKMVINQRELSALNGLPYLQQLVYFKGLRPYVDYQTGIVGLKRGISYQSLAEELYIEPHPGIRGGSPSKDQIRRALKGLERFGLITIQSQDWKLVIQCLLVLADYSEQNKVATKAPLLTAKPLSTNDIESTAYKDEFTEKDTAVISLKPAIPQMSEKDNSCVYVQFEQFWSVYPKKIGKQKAWEEFKKILPTQELFSQIIQGLDDQLKANSILKNHNLWTPKWKFPANWLSQHSWKDEIDLSALEEKQHAANKESTTKQQSTDFLWDSCKPGLYADEFNREPLWA